MAAAASARPRRHDELHLTRVHRLVLLVRHARRVQEVRAVVLVLEPAAAFTGLVLRNIAPKSRPVGEQCTENHRKY